MEKEEAAAQSLASMRHVSNGISTGGTSSTASATPLATTTTKGARKRRGRVTPPADLGLTTFDKSPTPIGKNVRELAALDVSIEAMPDWVDKEKMKVNAGNKKRRSHKAAYEHNWMKKAKKDRRDARYKVVYKKATTEAWQIKHKRSAAGKKGNS